MREISFHRATNEILLGAVECYTYGFILCSAMSSNEEVSMCSAVLLGYVVRDTNILPGRLHIVIEIFSLEGKL